MLKTICRGEALESTPKVSVIMPVYNGEKYLSDTIDSILEQTFTNIEFICIDDCSTDDSLAILREYAQKDKRVQVYQTIQNSGVDFVTNRGLDIAQGQYIYFIGDDDLLEKEALDLLVREIEWLKLDFVIFNYKVIYESQEVWEKFHNGNEGYGIYNGVWNGPKLYIEMTLHGDYHPECSHELWRHDYLKKYNIRFYEGLEHPYGDHVFFFHAMLMAKRVKLIPEKLYIYRRHDKSISSTLQKYTNETIRKDFTSMFAIFCERMRLLGELSSLPNDIMNLYAETERDFFLPRLEAWHHFLNHPHFTFRNPFHECCYRIFRSNLNKIETFKSILPVMHRKNPILLVDNARVVEACQLFKIHEYTIIDDDVDKNAVLIRDKIKDSSNILVFFTEKYETYKRFIEDTLLRKENEDFVDGRVLL